MSTGLPELCQPDVRTRHELLELHIHLLLRVRAPPVVAGILQGIPSLAVLPPLVREQALELLY
jgi:hypothetical protein